MIHGVHFTPSVGGLLLLLSQSFFAQIYGEAKNSRASPGHLAIAQLHELHKLQRHYTLNIDGLAEVRL